VKVLANFAFIVLGVLIGHGDWSHFTTLAVRTSTPPLGSQFLVSLLWVMVGYSG
jgi:APA family basic amino acid/polyamine antiporter